MLIVLAFAVALILLAVSSRMAMPKLRRWRMAAELRRDWWPRFERELRAYERRWQGGDKSVRRGPLG